MCLSEYNTVPYTSAIPANSTNQIKSNQIKSNQITKSILYFIYLFYLPFYIPFSYQKNVQRTGDCCYPSHSISSHLIHDYHCHYHYHYQLFSLTFLSSPFYCLATNISFATLALHYCARPRSALCLCIALHFSAL
jgi:hypothetical protein